MSALEAMEQALGSPPPTSSLLHGAGIRAPSTLQLRGFARWSGNVSEMTLQLLFAACFAQGLKGLKKAEERLEGF